MTLDEITTQFQVRDGSGNIKTYTCPLSKEAKQAILKSYISRQKVEEAIGEDKPMVGAKDINDHWGLTEDSLTRMLDNGKRLGSNELRAEIRKELGLDK